MSRHSKQVAYVDIFHVARGLDPFHLVSDLVDRIHQGPHIAGHIVQQVNGGHDGSV